MSKNRGYARRSPTRRTLGEFASTVFAPAAGAFFVIAIVWPMQCLLEARVPKLLALALVVLVIIVTFLGFATLGLWSSARTFSGS